MQYLEVSGAVRPLKWSLGVKWLITQDLITILTVLFRNVSGDICLLFYHFELLT